MDFREHVLPDLLTYPWPGNIAELNEVVQTYCGLAEVERGAPAHPAHPRSTDVQYLREALADAYQQFLDLLELERITGRRDLVISPQHRGMRRDELN